MGVLETSSKKACAIYSDMNKLQNDIDNGLWNSSDYAIIYVENLAYIYTVDGYASTMKVSDYNIVNSSNSSQIAKKDSVGNDGLNKVNFAYLSEWLK